MTRSASRQQAKKKKISPGSISVSGQNTNRSERINDLKRWISILTVLCRTLIKLWNLNLTDVQVIIKFPTSAKIVIDTAIGLRKFHVSCYKLKRQDSVLEKFQIIKKKYMAFSFAYIIKMYFHTDMFFTTRIN